MASRKSIFVQFCAPATPLVLLPLYYILVKINYKMSLYHVGEKLGLLDNPNFANSNSLQ